MLLEAYLVGGKEQTTHKEKAEIKLKMEEYMNLRLELLNSTAAFIVCPRLFSGLMYCRVTIKRHAKKGGTLVCCDRWGNGKTKAY